MTSILIIENQEPGDCATCPLFFRNAGICHRLKAERTAERKRMPREIELA